MGGWTESKAVAVTKKRQNTWAACVGVVWSEMRYRLIHSSWKAKRKGSKAEKKQKKERRSNRVHVVRADCRIDSSTTRHTHTTTSRHPSIHSSIHPSIHPSRNNRIYSVGYSGETDSAFGACGRADNVVATVIESVATRRLDEQPWCCLSRQRSAGRSR